MATITKAGSYNGTGAALNISVGFIPDYVMIVNVSAAAADVWFGGFAAATSLTISGTAALRAAPNGVTAFAGTPALAGQGFSVGPGLSTNAQLYYYIAVQNGPGGA
jgi:hypothetical protein